MCKRIGSKFRELSQNFQKLADGAVHWQVTSPGRTGGGNFQTGDSYFAQLCIVSLGGTSRLKKGESSLPLSSDRGHKHKLSFCPHLTRFSVPWKSYRSLTSSSLSQSVSRRTQTKLGEYAANPLTVSQGTHWNQHLQGEPCGDC